MSVIELTVPPVTVAPIVAVAVAGEAAVPVPLAIPTFGTVLYPMPLVAKFTSSRRYPTTAVTVRLPQPVRSVKLVGFTLKPVPGFAMDVLITCPDPLLNVMDPKKPVPPASPTLSTVSPLLAWQAPVTVQLTTQDGVLSNVATAVAPEPPPENDTDGGVA